MTIALRKNKALHQNINYFIIDRNNKNNNNNTNTNTDSADFV